MHTANKRSKNASSGRLQEVKTMENHKPSGPKSGRGRLQGVLVGGRLWQVVAHERWSHIKVQL